MRQLSILPELTELFGDLGDVELELARGGLRDSSIGRYVGAARSWKRYCLDRQEPFWDASTATLLKWLDWRVRASQSPRMALKTGLAAARFVQRGYCVLREIEAVPYTRGARLQLDAFSRSCTMNRSDRRVARPLRMDELDELLRRLRADMPTRWGVSYEQGALAQERDVAMLLVGWWGALRADDLARLDWSDLHIAPLGVELHLRASKTTHALLALAARPECTRLCAADALRRWGGLAAAAQGPLESGPVFGFATGDHVGRRLKTLFQRYGMPRGYTGHSLRAGFATECAAQHVADKLVQAHGRWRSAQQHAEYVRLARLWEDTPTLKLSCPT